VCVGLIEFNQGDRSERWVRGRGEASTVQDEAVDLQHGTCAGGGGSHS
jgi:hypothetical protein